MLNGRKNVAGWILMLVVVPLSQIPIITDDGEPIKYPLVLMQAVPSANLLDDFGASEGSDDETQIHITDKKIIQCKLTSHQIVHMQIASVSSNMKNSYVELVKSCWLDV
ncbi:hypothetical protein KFK09_009214 [Dendrobium nobile]|uniref:Uncharacterized protein n=1 Tax=Dendrobium nobile TaxID=94219 RepID=A0A8T3BN73_DENNO|nr:hypothetical protein KFK09_009214 [Dendrobium nobile]